MKRSVLKLLRTCGVFASFREVNKSKVLIVTYHRFSHTEDGRSTTDKMFEEQVSYLNNHYSLVSLSAIANSLTGGKSLPPRTAAITIDDGFKDAYDIAFPILKRHSAPATVFVITDFLDGKTWLWTDKLRYLTQHLLPGPITLKVHDRECKFDLNGESSRLSAATKVNEILKKLPSRAKDTAIAELASGVNVEIPPTPPAEYAPMSWQQAIEMDSSGVEIGSHTVTHPILPNVEDEELRWELSTSRSRLETVLNHSVQLFCYPNGNHDSRTRRAVADAGYTCAVTTKPLLNDRASDPLALSRVPTEMDLDHFVQTTCGFEQVKNSFRS